MNKIDERRFWLGSILAILGVALMFTGLFTPPVGEISGSVLGATGEIFLLAGAVLGISSYVDIKMKKYLFDEDEKKKK